jgi:hypothetical protein
MDAGYETLKIIEARKVTTGVVCPPDLHKVAEGGKPF